MASKKSFIDSLDKRTEALPFTRKMRVLLCSLSFMFYVLFFELVVHSVGRGMAMMAIIPVITASWLYGLLPGVSIAILTLPLTYLLYTLNSMSPVSDESLIFGTAGLIVVGIVVGRMRNISQLLKLEVFERNKVEKTLEEHRDGLEIAILEKTEDLKNTNEKLENFIEASIDPIIVSDESTYINRANKAFLKLLGYSEQEVIGESLNTFMITEPGSYKTESGDIVKICQKDIDTATERVGELFETGSARNWLAWVQAKDGKVIPAAANVVLFYDKNNDQS